MIRKMLEIIIRMYAILTDFCLEITEKRSWQIKTIALHPRLKAIKIASKERFTHIL
jgi:hypothetical protein